MSRSVRVLDNVADTISTGGVPSGKTWTIIWCEAGSVDVRFKGFTYKSLAALESFIFDVAPGDPIEVVATSAGTTAWRG